MNFLNDLRERLHRALQPLVADTRPYVEMLKPANDPKFGDFQANCAMPLKNILSMSPREIAAKIVAQWDVADLCHPPEIAGPGFINLRLRDDCLAKATQELLPDIRLGVSQALNPKTIVVDFSAPNVAKPMHVGHLRSSVIGNAIDRILRFQGHRVISDNHVGDWGTQFGMIIYGYKHFRDEAAYTSRPVTELARLYRLVNQLGDYHELKNNTATRLQAVETLAVEEKRLQKAVAIAPAAEQKELTRAAKKVAEQLKSAREEIDSANRKIQAVESDEVLHKLAAQHPQIGELSRRETAKLHQGDAENNALWQQFVPQCLDALNHMYRRMRIEFDMTLGESFYNPQLPGVVKKLQEAGLSRNSEGAVCVFVPGNEAPFIVQKGDGAYTYATTDLATIEYRVETLEADTILYVVDARQSEHFQLLFATAKKLGYQNVDLRHISFGTVLGEDRRPYKTRSGDTIGLEGLFDEAISKSRQILESNEAALKERQLAEGSESSVEMTTGEQTNVAETIGMGAVFYADLRHNRESDYVFSWDKMLATTGDTATYMQYAYARVHGICRKAGLDPISPSQDLAAIVLGHPSERKLALQLNRFGEAIDDVVNDYRPNLLTQYLYETANTFSEFYEHCPVVKENDEVLRTSRLRLCSLTARVLRQGLDLLGIQVVEQM